MRLLKSFTIQLEEFAANKIPAYAILSHTWEDDEVLFTDMERGSVQGKAGYKKIQFACAQAAADGHHYIWVDTCCIDKSSSAELSEAINSMYSWYQKAEICYAYLADVHAAIATTGDSAFADSRWFKRGWTLQELIGPSNLTFYSYGWEEIGKKSTLRNILSEITGIDVGTLTDVKRLEYVSVAKRMSWASGRATTRLEDMAYCLMGLFAVNMPMLYGEGERAFIRLQEEIMKNSDDHSLFAWVDPTASPESYQGMLAKSPADFVCSGNVMPYHDWEIRTPFSMSNRGLCIDLHLTPHEKDIYIASLDCPAPPDYEGFLGIYLKRVSSVDHQYARVRAQALCKLHERGSIETVYVRQSTLVPGPQDVYPQHIFQLRHGPTQADGYKVIRVVSPPSSKKSQTLDSRPILSSRAREWIPARMPFTFKIAKGTSQLAGALVLERQDGEKLVIMLGSMDFEVAFDAAPTAECEKFKEPIGNLLFEDLAKLFNPQKPGIYMDLENHRVRVSSETQVHLGVKYYIVDVLVEAIYKPQNPLEMLLPQLPQLLPQLDFQSDKPQPHDGSDSSRTLWKLKTPFKSSRAQNTIRKP
ncbi:hypothetical protein MMC14_001200 [Varicellaria rhodocarpa]|nr:hypothetical protein [Varicellaria rhodocarpa]